MIRNIEEKKHAENRIKKLEDILESLKRKLLPDNEAQFKAMAEVYVRKIIELREQIEAYIGMDIVIIKEEDINLHINGPCIDYGSIPISVLSSYLDNLKKSIQKTYSILNNISRAPQIISNLSDFRLMAYQPGSVNLALTLPESQISFFDEYSINNTLEVYFDILRWINSGIKSDYIDRMDEEIFEKLLINIVRTLPDDKNITNVEICGNKIKNKEKIYLNAKSREIVFNAIDKIEKKEQIVKLEGNIRELDLDKHTFILRNIQGYNLNQVKCILSDDDGDINSYFGSRVSIAGVFSGNILKVKYIKII